MNKGENKIMDKPTLSFQEIYDLIEKYFKDNNLTCSKRGRPRKYEDVWILTLWLYQNLRRISYRKVLEEARKFGFPTPTLSTYHYRVSKLPLDISQYLLTKIEEILAHKN